MLSQGLHPRCIVYTESSQGINSVLSLLDALHDACQQIFKTMPVTQTRGHDDSTVQGSGERQEGPAHSYSNHNIIQQSSTVNNHTVSLSKVQSTYVRL